MTNPQTATERFLRHGVAGGYNIENLLFNGGVMFPNEFSSKGNTTVPALLLNPALWEAAGRSLGWGGRYQWVSGLDKDFWCLDCGHTVKNVTETPTEFLGGCHVGCEKSKMWLEKQKGLLDHLAAHPGDVEGYLSTLVTNENSND